MSVNLGLRFLRKIYHKVFSVQRQSIFIDKMPQYIGEDSSNFIYEKLLSDSPCMISRLGNTEFSCVKFYNQTRGSLVNKSIKYITGEIEDIVWSSKMKSEIQNNAGFFPATIENLERFSELMMKEMQQIDILGSIFYCENEFKEELKNAKTIGFEDLNPYNHKNPWSRVLKNKKVLVIHPFDESILKQYQKRELIFKNKNILPEFNLITYKPVQSVAGNYKNLQFKNWFEALESMKCDISKIDFDIAIIGCGSYGLPLASYIKTVGKKSVHIGGSVQILFGIIGKRWETEYDLSEHINEHWIRPSINEMPNNYKNVEGGCYW
jgi:hypothetical protein